MQMEVMEIWIAIYSNVEKRYFLTDCYLHVTTKVALNLSPDSMKYFE